VGSQSAPAMAPAAEVPPSGLSPVKEGRRLALWARGLVSKAIAALRLWGSRVDMPLEGTLPEFQSGEQPMSMPACARQQCRSASFGKGWEGRPQTGALPSGTST